MTFILSDPLVKIIFGYAYPDLEDIIDINTKMNDLDPIYKLMNITHCEFVCAIKFSCKIGNEALALSLYDHPHVSTNDDILKYLSIACEYGCLNFVVEICDSNLHRALGMYVATILHCINLACSGEYFEIVDYLIKKFNIEHGNFHQLKVTIQRVAGTCKRSTAVKIFDRYKKYIDEAEISIKRLIEPINDHVRN